MNTRKVTAKDYDEAFLGVAADMPAITEQEVLSALKSCYDPEIPVNIVDLGLIYTINFAPATSDTLESASAGTPETEAKQDVTVDMTLTAQGCPEHVNISAQVKSRIEQLPGVRNCNVNIVWTPPWTPERLSTDAKKQLGID
jgi:metal-sulfur cluster biosynthetic enzyme